MDSVEISEITGPDTEHLTQDAINYPGGFEAFLKLEKGEMIRWFRSRVAHVQERCSGSVIITLKGDSEMIGMGQLLKRMEAMAPEVRRKMMRVI